MEQQEQPEVKTDELEPVEKPAGKEKKAPGKKKMTAIIVIEVIVIILLLLCIATVIIDRNHAWCDVLPFLWDADTCNLYKSY